MRTIITLLIAIFLELTPFVALAQHGAPSLPKAVINDAVPPEHGVLTTDVAVDTAGCGRTYLFGGGKFFTVTVPPATSFPVGCTIRLWNIDPMPAYITSTFLGTIKNTTLVVLSGTGPSSVGETLAHAAITPGTTVTACPATGCGTIGSYTISNSQTLSVATFAGTASGVYLSASSVAGTITIGDAISGRGIPAGTIITGQASGIRGGAGVYVTSLPTNPTADTITSIPEITFYGISGGRGKAVAGLITKMLYPGQEIKIISLGSGGWAQPFTPPRWQLRPNYGQVRLFISPTGSDTGNDGLGGCDAGKPFATLQAAAIFLATQIDFRGDDPVTVQFCPGVYGAGTQDTHFPVEIPGRNGGASVRFTGSPGPLGQCQSSSTVTLEADRRVPIFDSELPYVWIYVECMTLTTQGAPVIEANRGSWIQLGIGLAFAGSTAGAAQIIAQNGSHIVLDNNALLSVLGGQQGTGFFMALGGGSLLLNTGGSSSGVIWNSGAPADFNYKSVFLASASGINLGPATLFVNGRMNGYSVLADESWIYSEGAIPGAKGAQLTDGTCLSGLVNRCARPSQ
jgi:hypothetical protein